MNSTAKKIKLGVKRAKKKKNPFRFRPKSSKPKHTHLSRRHRQETRFRIYGIIAIVISFLFLGSLFWSIITNGYSAFLQTRINLTVELSQEIIDPEYTGDPKILARANYRKLVQNALKQTFPDVAERKEKRALYGLVSKSAAYDLKDYVLAHPGKIGSTQDFWFLASSDVDMFYKGKISRESDEDNRKIKDNQIVWLDSLDTQGKIRRNFNSDFFTHGDSRNPEYAGLATAIIGSIYTILICIAVAFPLGVASAVYLEEFAPKNRFTSLIEVNINNLAAVPSIIFGLLGLSIYLNFFGMPRSSSLVGGLTLALLVLPVIVITTRNAIKAIPPSIRYAATALGASKVQVTFQHVVPYAMPGIMTGVILSIARALGETAPLLMIGMVAFVANVPASPTDPSTSLPVQIYLWADSPELGFSERTFAAIIILLVFLVLVNAIAIYMRKRMEIKW